MTNLLGPIVVGLAGGSRVFTALPQHERIRDLHQIPNGLDGECLAYAVAGGHCAVGVRPGSGQSHRPAIGALHHEISTELLKHCDFEPSERVMAASNSNPLGYITKVVPSL